MLARRPCAAARNQWHELHDELAARTPPRCRRAPPPRVAYALAGAVMGAAGDDSVAVSARAWRAVIRVRARSARRGRLLPHRGRRHSSRHRRLRGRPSSGHARRPPPPPPAARRVAAIAAVLAVDAVSLRDGRLVHAGRRPAAACGSTSSGGGGGAPPRRRGRRRARAAHPPSGEVGGAASSSSARPRHRLGVARAPRGSSRRSAFGVDAPPTPSLPRAASAASRSRPAGDATLSVAGRRSEGDSSAAGDGGLGRCARFLGGPRSASPPRPRRAQRPRVAAVAIRACGRWRIVDAVEQPLPGSSRHATPCRRRLAASRAQRRRRCAARCGGLRMLEPVDSPCESAARCVSAASEAATRDPFASTRRAPTLGVRRGALPLQLRRGASAAACPKRGCVRDVWIAVDPLLAAAPRG